MAADSTRVREEYDELSAEYEWRWQEIRRILRPSGRLVLTDWCDGFLACRLYERVSAGQLDRYKVSWLWGMMTVSAIRA